MLDIQPANILLQNRDEDALDIMARLEGEEPSARKIIDEQRIIYRSRQMPQVKGWGLPILCDFGEARFARVEHTDDIQAEPYRAPEVMLKRPWNEKADIWSFGCMVRWHELDHSEIRLHEAAMAPF
jgi:serine/threonine-protein kinase SRPK3